MNKYGSPDIASALDRLCFIRDRLPSDDRLARSEWPRDSVGARRSNVLAERRLIDGAGPETVNAAYLHPGDFGLGFMLLRFDRGDVVLIPHACEGVFV